MPNVLGAKRCLFLSINAVGWRFALVRQRRRGQQVDSTPQDVFDSMRGSFQPAKAKGVHARYQWDSERTERWRMVDRRKRWNLQDGQRENPQSNVTFIASRQGLGRHLP